MDFRIADTFTDSLARLTGDEQKVVKTTAFDLQLNPAHPSMSLHRIEQSKDKNFWSVRAGSDKLTRKQAPRNRLKYAIRYRKTLTVANTVLQNRRSATCAPTLRVPPFLRTSAKTSC